MKTQILLSLGKLVFSFSILVFNMVKILVTPPYHSYHLTRMSERYTNTDLKICQYLRLYTKKEYVEDFTLKHLLFFEICARGIVEKFVYKHSKAMELLKISLLFQIFTKSTGI